MLERLTRGIARAALALSAAAMLASLATIGYSVVRRYVFGTPVAWTDELVGYLLVASVMLAAADSLFGGEHISVDILTERLTPRGKRIAFLFGLAAVAAASVLLVVEGIGMVQFSHQVGLRSNGISRSRCGFRNCSCRSAHCCCCSPPSFHSSPHGVGGCSHGST